jgi:hypothetical protein
MAKECYSMKLELLTNATVVNDVIRFVSQKSIDKAESMDTSNEDDNSQLRVYDSIDIWANAEKSW